MQKFLLNLIIGFLLTGFSLQVCSLFVGINDGRVSKLIYSYVK